MFFKTLEIQGFKSFADRTVLSFDKRITAVVGSNGNGKSNISDALRWVMGEQSAKTMRAENPSGVIFYGTEKRRQMGMAVVTLTIDNTDRTLPVDETEIVIARRLYRTGDSEFLINGGKCRLKDIQMLLMGTGLGRDGYSIIGQGRVSEIVRSKSTERRVLFEEAAGVSKFLHRKAEAERNLSKADEDLARLMDIEKEVSSRLPKLEREAEKAEKAKILLESEKELDISVAVYEYDTVSASLGELEDNILKNRGECEHYERELSGLETEQESISEEKARLNAAADELRSAAKKVQEQLAGTDTDVAVMNNDIRNNENRISENEERANNTDAYRQRYEGQIAELTDELELKRGKIADTEREIADTEKKRDNFTAENDTLDRAHKELLNEIARLEDRETEADVMLRKSEENIVRLRETLEDAAAQAEKSDEILAGYREQLAESEGSLARVKSELTESSNRLSGHKMLLSAKTAAFDTEKAELDKLRHDLVQKKSRYDVLHGVEENMQGYGHSVKAVITAARQKRLSGVDCTVADAVNVEKKYGTAIEVALGAALQNIIVANEDAAKRCISFLKETRGGRATFLPVTSVKGRYLDKSVHAALEKENGYLGLAFELIKYESKYDGVIRSMLGTTAIVDNIDSASLIARKHGYKFRIITLDGQVINSGGSFTGGSVKDSGGIITRKNELEALLSQITEAEDLAAIKKDMLTDKQAEINRLSIETEGYRDSVESLEKEEIKYEAEAAGIRNLIKQCETQSKDGSVIIDKNEAAIASETELRDEYAKVKETVHREIEQKTETATSGAGNLDNAVARINACGELIHELNLRLMSYNKDIESLERETAVVRENLNSIGADGVKLFAEIQRLKDENVRLNGEVRRLIEGKADIAAELSGNAEREKAVIAEINIKEKRGNEIGREIREKSEAKEKFSNALAVSVTKKENALKDLEKIKNNLWENRNELTMSEARKLAKPLDNVNAAKNELLELRRKINALGEVTFSSIEEYAELKERHGEMSHQIKDVETAKRELIKLIDELTDDIRTRFLNSFNEINSHFRRIYAEIDGGKAELRLSDPSDVLTSGIEINASPSGKAVKSTISLSGGEQAMVALTIYLAILLHRPTPFCMLDEVDAALDEANVVKYVTYLKQFSSRTQLMLITHRRGTIEGCDILYGVFMQEEGVSRLLRQEFIDDDVVLA